jgi:H+/Cl- antiporter ClcA
MQFPGDEKLKFLFDHIRNLALSATVTGVGVHVAKAGYVAGKYSGMGLGFFVALIGLFLFALNLCHPFVKAEKANVPKWLIIVLFPVSYVVGILIYEVLWTRGNGL